MIDMGALTWIGRVAGLACLLAAPVAAQAHSLDEILSAKTLVVGINPNLPPLLQRPEPGSRV
jgi:polar amino acid transport system substrate-binding protein